MSEIYIQEPPTNGKVLLSTTLGDIDIELWSKEAPKACRNFVQLCMEGYYDNTIFHRVEKGFIAQGGDPTGTGTGGESIYGEPFKDEFHQRLKFNRRGLVAMANAGPHDNGSQFFFTLDRCIDLTKKHTIFGKVTGDTIYNMIRFNDIDVDEDNRPHNPPKIKGAQILFDPFDDIEPRVTKQEENKVKKGEKPKSKSKATKNYKLLSFGEEAEEDEEETNVVTKDLCIKSSHDVLEDPKLSSVSALDGDVQEDMAKDGKKQKKKKKKKKSQDEDDLDEQQKELSTKDKSDHSGDEAEEDKGDVLEQKKKESKEEKAAKNQLLNQMAKEREEFINKQKTESMLQKGASRQDKTLALLASFQSKVTSIDDDNDEKEESGKDSWFKHKLEFTDPNDDAKDANTKGDDWYDIYDPRNPVNKRRRMDAEQNTGKPK